MGVSIHAFAYMVILLAVSNMIGLIPQTVKDGSKKLQGFFAGQLSWVIMVGVGVVYVSIADVLAVLTFSGKYPLLLWHGGGMTGKSYETTPDGRPGWLSYFIRSGWKTYLSDAVERG